MTETIPESTFANAWICSACGASVPFGLITSDRIPHECPKSDAGTEFYLDTALNTHSAEVPRADYDAIKRVNFSTLKLLGRSPAHYDHNLNNPSDDTDQRALGRAVHMAVFEPERFRAKVVPWDAQTTGGNSKPRRGKEWDAFLLLNAGKEILTADAFARCEAIQKAVRANPAAQVYLLDPDGRPEETLLWTATATTDAGAVEIECKVRLDWITPTATVELKTTKDGSPGGFGRQAFSLGYHTQAAWQIDARRAARSEDRPHVIVAVESAAPHVVQVYKVPPPAVDLGRETYQDWLDALARCRAAGDWPGYTLDGGERELELPRYALPFEDEDISGLGLDMEG